MFTSSLWSKLRALEPDGMDPSSTADDGTPTRHASKWRIWSAFMSARVAVSLVVLLLQVTATVLNQGMDGWTVVLCAWHALVCWLARRGATPSTNGPHFHWPWLRTVGLDVAVYTTLSALQPAGGLNYSLLYGLPVLMAASLGPQRRAFATAAMVTLALLGEAAWSAWWSEENSAKFFQTALAGTGYFLTAWLAHQLTLRLAREEQLAQHNRLMARVQGQVNALIIESLSDGILVADASGTVHSHNPAARRMLSDHQGEPPPPPPFSLYQRSFYDPLRQMLKTTYQQQRGQTAEVLLEPAEGVRLRLRARTKLTHANPDAAQDEPGGQLCVLVLEDLHELEARVRSEKLVGMGRMSVAVAHEIRNPLSAIAQANALLAEDLTEPMQVKLVGMIHNHTQRLNRMVDDILNVVRLPSQPAPPDTPLMDLDTTTQTILQEWSDQHRAGLRVIAQLQAPQSWVRFDAEHLRRILVNLLDNAARYASDAVGAIQVHTWPEGATAVRLSVWSDGHPLDPSVRRHLFEPFFSSESRSSGMGLYLCRELCDRYNTTLDYERAARHERTGNEFFMLIPTDSSSQPQEPTHFT